MRSCYYSTHHSTTYFWERVLFRKKRFIMCYFSFETSLFVWIFRPANTSLNTVSYSCYTMLYMLSYVYTCYMVYLTICGMLGMWYAREVTYWACGMLEMCGCWGFRMLRIGMLGMWHVQDVGCCGCGMLGMWRCSRCGMLGIWDVRYVGCSV